MRKSFVACFKSVSCEETTTHRDGTSFIYRDELDKKKSANKPYGDCFIASSKLLHEREKRLERRSYEDGVKEDKGVIYRVKVKMTKQEAARLLSKCKDEGVLDFKDLAHEIVKIPINRINVMTPGTPGSAMLLLSLKKFN